MSHNEYVSENSGFLFLFFSRVGQQSEGFLGGTQNCLFVSQDSWRKQMAPWKGGLGKSYCRQGTYGRVKRSQWGTWESESQLLPALALRDKTRDWWPCGAEVDPGATQWSCFGDSSETSWKPRELLCRPRRSASVMQSSRRAARGRGSGGAKGAYGSIPLSQTQ